jgi:hypothetical protein
MRIEVGDAVILKPEAVQVLLEQGEQNLKGQVAEVVDRHIVPDGIDLVLRFDQSKMLLHDVPIQFVQHIGIC